MLFRSRLHQTDRGLHIAKMSSASPGANRRPDAKIRRAALADAAHISRVHWQSWQESYSGILPSSYLNSFSEEDRRKFWKKFLAAPKPHTFVLVAEVHAQPKIVGFLAGGPLREIASPQEAEIYAIYMLGAYRRRRIGTLLLSNAMSIFQAGGIQRVGAWVLENNSGAVAFYKHFGGMFVGEKTEIVKKFQLKQRYYLLHQPGQHAD